MFRRAMAKIGFRGEKGDAQRCEVEITMSFYGYKRENGWVGTRNTVGIISLGSCK